MNWKQNNSGTADILYIIKKQNNRYILIVLFFGCRKHSGYAFADYSMRGRTYRYTEDNILFPFGYGLSYTTFEYSELSAPAENASGEGITCRLKVKNCGSRTGETVILFFFKHEDGADWEPLKQFAGSVRIALDPGETKDVMFTYPAEFLEFADEEGIFHPVTGKLTLMAEDQELTVSRK